MDKVDTALTATEDNAAAIRALNNKLREHIGNVGPVSGESKIGSVTFVVGLQVASDGSVTFGKIKSDGNVCAVIAFDSLAKRAVAYDKKTLVTTATPAIVRLPKGDAELSVANVTMASAMLFYLHS